MVIVDICRIKYIHPINFARISDRGMSCELFFFRMAAIWPRSPADISYPRPVWINTFLHTDTDTDTGKYILLVS